MGRRKLTETATEDGVVITDELNSNCDCSISGCEELPEVVETTYPLQEEDIETAQFEQAKALLKSTIESVTELISVREKKGVNSLVYAKGLEDLKRIDNRLLIR